MKKILKYVSIFLCAFFIFGVNQALASNGPSSTGSSIAFTIYGGDYFVIYEDGTINNDLLNGVSYDRDSNTLTLNNYKSNYELIIYNMGEDFKLNVVGENEISNIYYDAESYFSSLNIVGNGILTVNKEKASNNSIHMINGRIIIDDSVTLKVYALENDETISDYSPTVISTIYTDFVNANDAIIFKNRALDIVTTERDWYSQGTELILGISYSDKEQPQVYRLVKKDDKFFGLIIDNTNYYVTGSEIAYDSFNNLYFLDNTNHEDDKIYNYEGFISSGYELTDEDVTIFKDAKISGYLIFTDNNNNEYAIYIDYSGSEEEYYVFSMTNNTIKLANDKDYILLESSNVAFDGLTAKESKIYLDTYSHSVNAASLEIMGNTYEFIKGANQSYIVGQDSITFTIQADYSLFKNGGKVFIDGKEINDYISSEGSTIITLSKEYLNTLNEGKHTIKVVFNNGESSEAEFVISKENNPKTIDNIISWIGMAFVSTIGLLTLKKKLRISNN